MYVTMKDCKISKHLEGLQHKPAKKKETGKRGAYTKLFFCFFRLIYQKFPFIFRSRAASVLATHPPPQTHKKNLKTEEEQSIPSAVMVKAWQSFPNY